MLGIVGLVIAIILMIVGAYKGWGALPLTIACACVALLFNGMNVWTGLSTFYMAGYAGTYSSYFLIFIFSALYARMMNVTKAPIAIGMKFVEWFGVKNAILVTFVIVCLLTYGGISLFVVVFAATPIMFTLFKEADIPRHVCGGVLGAGSATLTMTSLPGSPQLTNIIPAQYLGTTMTAAPVLGLIASAMLFILCFVYLKGQEKKSRKKGEHFTFPVGYDESQINIKREELPSAGKSFIPLIVVIVIIVVGSKVKYTAIEEGVEVTKTINSAMLTVVAMLIGTLVCILLFAKRFKGIKWTKEVGGGLGDGISAIGGLAGVVAFGTVVQNTPAFQSICAWVLSVDIGIYWKAIFSTAVISGITGSSSGGLRIMFGAMGEYFLNSGANLETLHRLTSIAAGSLDSLPHSSGCFLMLAYMGLTHKEAYRHSFWCTVLIPLFVVIVLTAVVSIMGI